MAGGQKRTFDDSGLGSETSRAYRTSPSISDLGDSDHDRESSLVGYPLFQTTATN